jgi:LmbE family N-acetylglucosaminyl deacetylase
MDISTILKNSILLVAHPDDEVLWFSSIFDKVDEVIFCFINSLSNPHWTTGRRQILSKLPIKKVSSLEMEESGVFNCADWNRPVIKEYGMEITKRRVSDKKYKENYYKIKEKLGVKLANYKNVFTHNPWGEYGNEEHVQVYRVVKGLQKKMNYNIWISNYCGNKSFPLMLSYISGFNSDYITLKTNKSLAEKIKATYERHRCWTWYKDWVWFNEESFMNDDSLRYDPENAGSYGHIFPINMIKEELPHKGLSRVIHKIKRLKSGENRG